MDHYIYIYLSIYLGSRVVGRLKTCNTGPTYQNISFFPLTYLSASVCRHGERAGGRFFIWGEGAHIKFEDFLKNCENKFFQAKFRERGNVVVHSGGCFPPLTLATSLYVPTLYMCTLT